MAGWEVARRSAAFVHAARLHHGEEHANIMQFEVTFNALDVVHSRSTPDIKMDITQSDNSIRREPD